MLLFQVFFVGSSVYNQNNKKTVKSAHSIIEDRAHTETESAVQTSKCYTTTRKAFSKMSKKGLKKEPTSFPEMMESKREWKMAIKWKSFIKEDRQRDSTLPRFSFSTDCIATKGELENHFRIILNSNQNCFFSLKTVEKD